MSITMFSIYFRRRNYWNTTTNAPMPISSKCQIAWIELFHFPLLNIQLCHAHCGCQKQKEKFAQFPSNAELCIEFSYRQAVLLAIIYTLIYHKSYEVCRLAHARKLE